MVTHSRRPRANGSTLFVPININQNYRGIESLVNKELAKSTNLTFIQRLLRMRFGSNRTIDIIPQISCALTSHSFNMLTAYQFVIIALTDAGCHAKDESSLSAGTHTFQCALVDLIGLTTAVALFFHSLYADERSDIACLTKLLCHFVSQEGSIGKELEVAIMMFLKDTEKSLIHQRFAPQYAEELGAMTLALANDSINLLHRQTLPSSLTHPTPLTSQITSLRDGNHVKGWEEGLTSLLTAFKLTHVQQIWPAEIPAELPQ